MNSEAAVVMPAHVEVLSPQTVQLFDGASWYGMADADHFWMRWRLAEALRMLDAAGLSPQEPLRALEVGGGVGVLRCQLEAATAWTVDLGELDTTALAHSAAGRGRTLHYDILERRPELHEAYDAIVLFDVLEHIENTAPFVDALFWHLRPGGLLFVNVPALSSGYSRYDEVIGHVRRYSKETLRAELPDGVSVVGLRHWGMGLVPLLFARKGWLATGGRNSTSEATVRAGFKSPNRLASRAIDLLMSAELRTLDPAPVGTSLMMLARKASA